MTLAQHPPRRLRLGMVGGGRNGNIGAAHRAAALIDGRWDIVAGCFSRDAEVSRASAADWIIAPERAYDDYRAMAAAEAVRLDRIDAVAIVTPNSTHHPIAMAFLDHGFHVICDKPLANSLADAEELVAATRRAGAIFAVTHTYSGYPMARQARQMIAEGMLGDIRSVVVEYASQYQSAIGVAYDWQDDPAVCGPLGALASTGTHAHHLAEFVTGLRVTELSADLASVVPGHTLDDHATLHLRFENGARGMLWNTTAAPGHENGLAIRVFGSEGGLAWAQEHPNHLRFTARDAQPVTLSRGGFGSGAAAAAWTRVPSGHPEGYLEAFANLYAEIAEAILDRAAGRDGSYLFPTVEAGARGVAMLFAALASSQANAAFVPLEMGTSRVPEPAGSLEK